MSINEQPVTLHLAGRLAKDINRMLQIALVRLPTPDWRLSLLTEH